MPIGTGLTFMMSAAAPSNLQFVILRKAMKKELIAAFAATVATRILIIGLLFNLFL